MKNIYGDKRIIINSREPRENEFVMHENTLVNGVFIKKVLDYVAANSNLDYEIIDNDNFVNRSMYGWRFIKKGNSSQ